MPETLLASGQPLGPRRESSHSSSTARNADPLQFFLSAGMRRSGACAPMLCLGAPAALAPIGWSERTSPTLEPSSSCVVGAESPCRLQIPRKSAQRLRLSGIVLDGVRSRVGRNHCTEPPSTPDERALQMGELFPGRQGRSHAFERMPAWLRRDRAFGSQQTPACLLLTMLHRTDPMRSDRAAWPASSGSLRANGMLERLHGCETPAPHWLAVSNRSIKTSPYLRSRHTLVLKAKLQPSESSARPVGTGAIDA